MSHGAVPLAERMARVPFSRIRKVFERPKVLERDGRPVIFLETGRPGFDTLAHVKDAAVREFRRRRDFIVPALSTIDGLSCLQPGGAFWLWLNIRRRRATSQDFAPTLLETAYVSLVPGPVFGESGQGHVRLSYANSYERLTDAVKRILRFCT